MDNAADRSLEAIAAEVARCDYEAAAMIAIARARKETLPIEIAMTVLPGIELPQVVIALIASASGDRTRLVELLHHRRFPQTKENGELEAIVLYAAWLAGARPLAELRRLAARQMFADGYALLAVMAKQVDDANVALAVKAIAGFDTEYAKEVAAMTKSLGATVDATYAGLPPEVVAAAGAVGFTVRATQEPGRNDPCPCGSGLKYKKCHSDKPVEAGSPIPGVSWEAFLTTAADQMTGAHVATLPLKDLARVAIDKLSPEARRAAGRAFLKARQWDRARAVIGEDVDERIQLVLERLWCKEDVAADLALLPEEKRKLFALEGATDLGAEIPREIEKALRSEDKTAQTDLAHALLRTSPWLGILAARACIGAWLVEDPDLLLEAVEEVRDELGLPPTDPAWDVLDTIAPKGGKRRGAKKAVDEDLQKQVQEHAARAKELERSHDSLKRQLDEARTLPAAALAKKTEAKGAYEAKIEELEALIREGNAERRELRRQLDQKAPDEKPVTVVAVDDEPGDDLPQTTRGLVIPRFDRRVLDAFDEVPQAVAAEAMRTIGTLSAGDGFAWMGVKQAKDMVKQVLMARVGIHHRLLFRVGEGAMDVIDLVTRETLMTTLKRIRLNRT